MSVTELLGTSDSASLVELSPSFLKVKPTVTLPDGLVMMGTGAEDSTNVTRNREFVADGKKLDGDDGSDGGVTGDDDEEDGDPDCLELTKKLESATRETWKKKIF